MLSVSQRLSLCMTCITRYSLIWRSYSSVLYNYMLRHLSHPCCLLAAIYRFGLAGCSNIIFHLIQKP
ncbi:uncharacterized protein BO87DRAFT_204169 [Aspergillus neoniger CBS 115656]|uniref:Uncharacterized protein n=1 Tax=Aspergillus neoniger (strain CBS 115656) TaxID=1448310 RepID=A0A318ZAC4_ASPNB|nr:hypothetical protein BO87DRAFT_204169 [Aspergillus neoniger CBS 115656]PYH37238.1 hypothetical protein BO87DRAFT_204169 [Aspergillus neoniger CBS 115656]